MFVSASVYEADDSVTPRGYNTAICISPSGDLVARTRKLHIPVTEGYHEDHYFVGVDDGFPVVGVADTRAVGFPTCWDQWFPELARAYSLQGAEVIVYPTAIGSEPDHPDFDTQPLWQQVIVGNGIANGTFMVAVNRTGTERVAADAPEITFYGSSFISDPYGRVLVQAPRDRPAVIVADLDLDARSDWLELFPFLTTRRPDAYDPLTAPTSSAIRPNPTHRPTRPCRPTGRRSTTESPPSPRPPRRPTCRIHPASIPPVRTSSRNGTEHLGRRDVGRCRPRRRPTARCGRGPRDWSRR